MDYINVRYTGYRLSESVTHIFA